MKQISNAELLKFRSLAEGVRFGGVYVRAVMNGLQSGDIFSDGRAALVWHRCGFARILGEYGEEFLNEIVRLRTDGRRRLVLFTEDDEVSGYFEKRGASVGRRLFFEHRGGSREAPLCEGYTAREIGPKIFGRLEGRVVPKLFWSDAGEFSRSGSGFCIMCGKEPAAWSFVAASDGREADIGVEASPAHRGKGLAFAAAVMTLKGVVASGRKPVWACDEQNTASQGLARKLGFEKAGECRVIKSENT